MINRSMIGARKGGKLLSLVIADKPANRAEIFKIAQANHE
jgi:hypothetical protein